MDESLTIKNKKTLWEKEQLLVASDLPISLEVFIVFYRLYFGQLVLKIPGPSTTMLEGGTIFHNYFERKGVSKGFVCGFKFRQVV